MELKDCKICFLTDKAGDSDKRKVQEMEQVKIYGMLTKTHKVK